MYLFKYGQECHHFLIILDGEATMEIGKDKIIVKAGLFSYYGVNVLINDSNLNQSIEEIIDYNDKPYIPEFSLIVKEKQRCVYFQITRDDWIQLVKNSIMERKYSIVPSAAVTLS